MKRFVVITCSIMFISSQIAFCQYTGSKRKGFVITRSGDTLKGIIKIGNEIINQMKVRFYDSLNNKRVYKPFELIGYSFEAEYTTLDTIERYNQRPKIRWKKVRYLENYETKNWPASATFLLRLENGYVKFYEWYLPNDKPYIAYDKKTGQRYRSKYSASLLQKGNENMINTDSWGRKIKKFNYNASEYFSDYEELSSRILNNAYKTWDIEIIVNEYNQWYKEKNVEARDTLKPSIQHSIDTLKSAALSQEKNTLKEKPNQLVMVKRDKSFFNYYFCTFKFPIWLLPFGAYIDAENRSMTPLYKYGNVNIQGWKSFDKIISSINDQEATQLFKESKKMHVAGLTIAYTGYLMIFYSAIEIAIFLDPETEAPFLKPAAAVPVLIISSGVFTFGIITINLGQKKLNKSVDRYNYVISHRN
ncbi:MAG: hypothetical protein FVQ77_00500 [Cytophagales bacterium]|nr:hypothetical protein [Cytophagales bacterium]